jgi:hypothetical protein
MFVFAADSSAEPLHGNSARQAQAEGAGGVTVVPAGGLVLDGYRMTCGRFATMLDPNLNDYAAATSPRFIILNMRYVARVPTAVKLWIYTHECSHKIGGGPDESKADCYAVRRGRAAGWLTPSGLDQVCNFISAARGDKWHPSGPERCQLMRACYDKASAPPPAGSPLSQGEKGPSDTPASRENRK